MSDLDHFLHGIVSEIESEKRAAEDLHHLTDAELAAVAFGDDAELLHKLSSIGGMALRGAGRFGLLGAGLGSAAGALSAQDGNRLRGAMRGAVAGGALGAAGGAAAGGAVGSAAKRLLQQGPKAFNHLSRREKAVMGAGLFGGPLLATAGAAGGGALAARMDKRAEIDVPGNVSYDGAVSSGESSEPSWPRAALGVDAAGRKATPEEEKRQNDTATPQHVAPKTAYFKSAAEAPDEGQDFVPEDLPEFKNLKWHERNRRLLGGVAGLGLGALGTGGVVAATPRMRSPVARGVVGAASAALPVLGLLGGARLGEKSLGKDKRLILLDNDIHTGNQMATQFDRWQEMDEAQGSKDTVFRRLADDARKGVGEAQIKRDRVKQSMHHKAALAVKLSGLLDTIEKRAEKSQKEKAKELAAVAAGGLGGVLGNRAGAGRGAKEQKPTPWAAIGSTILGPLGGAIGGYAEGKRHGEGVEGAVRGGLGSLVGLTGGATLGGSLGAMLGRGAQGKALAGALGQRLGGLGGSIGGGYYTTKKYRE